MNALRSVARRLLGRDAPDYRDHLFDELRAYLGSTRPRRVLEIGPKDGKDSTRLLRLGPDRLVLVDLPAMAPLAATWLPGLDGARVQYISANVMYSPEVQNLEPFDCIWCSGVLYHNPEQLRMIRVLYDLLGPGGVLVLESATTRHRRLRDESCVEVIFPPSPALKAKHHLSLNVSHVPSARAVAAWLAMVGFDPVLRSACHRKVSRALARTRVAYLGTKPATAAAGLYYTLSEGDGFVVGKAL